MAAFEISLGIELAASGTKTYSMVCNVQWEKTRFASYE